MTPTDLKTILDAATPGPWQVSNDGHMIYVRALHYSVMWNGNNAKARTQQARNEIALAAAAVNLLPAFLRLWEAAEKVEQRDDAYAPDGCYSIEELRDVLHVLREMKGTQ